MRLPSKPLFDYLRINLEHQDETLELLAERLDVSYDALVRAHYQGHLSFGFADTVAIRLGLHPCLIWGDLWWQDTVLDPGYEGALADAA